MVYLDEDRVESLEEKVQIQETNSQQAQRNEAGYISVMEEEDMIRLGQIKDILDIPEEEYPEFVLAKNKARFKKKMIWYKAKKIGSTLLLFIS